MKGIEFAEVRDTITRAFNGDEFDMFLFERLDFDRPQSVADGSFRVVVTNVLKQAMQEGWDPILIAEVAAVRPLKQEVQDVYKKYAQGLVDEARHEAIEGQKLKALERFGLGSKVNLQKVGVAQLPAAMMVTYAGFEKTIKPYLPALNVGLWREQLFKLEGRVCRVEVGTGTMATGFLVGPDVLLTNYHVLRAVIENQSPSAKVRFRFDYRVLANGIESQGVLASLHPTDWKIDDSPYAEAEAKNRPDEALPTVDQLDYALVRLDRPIGNEPLNQASPNLIRGWIPLPTTAPAITPNMPILILQHPNKEPLKLAFDTAGVIKIYENGTRVRYATNTDSGSSGSPCFDVNWNLVALHHYGDPAFDHVPSYNQGIPINMIRDRLKRNGKDGVLGDVFQ